MKMEKSFLLSALLILAACSSNKPMGTAGYLSGAKSGYFNSEATRLIQKFAGLNIEVESPHESLNKTQIIIEKNSGYIDSTATHSPKSIWIVAKVPQENLEATIDELGRLGRVTSEQRRTNDVTGEVIDIDAKLKNLLALRTRFRELLADAHNVEDVGRRTQRRRCD